MMGAVILVDASKQFMASDEGIDKFRTPRLAGKAKSECSSSEQGARPVMVGMNFSWMTIIILIIIFSYLNWVSH